MATIPSGLTKAIAGLSDVFSKRAWPLVQVLLAGAILAVGRRTVSAVLRVMGLSQERQLLGEQVTWQVVTGGGLVMPGLIVIIAF